MPEDERQPGPDALTILEGGAFEIEGRMPWSSNATFLARLCLDGFAQPVVYKPHRGERPLWDFPDGLYQREVAAHMLSEALGWGVVPETVVRTDGPFGIGSVQRFVEADFSEHYFTLLEDEARHDALRVIATFDLLANNADRKSGHCLLAADGHVWGIDHGLCFHVEDKLRTVMWDFAGDEVPASLLADVERIAQNAAALPPAMAEVLHPVEVEAVVRRARALLRRPRFPSPSGSHRDYPWPMV